MKSLVKLSNKVKKDMKLPDHCIYHQGLIKILEVIALERKGREWVHFLACSGFTENVKKY